MPVNADYHLDQPKLTLTFQSCSPSSTDVFFANSFGIVCFVIATKTGLMREFLRGRPNNRNLLFVPSSLPPPPSSQQLHIPQTSPLTVPLLTLPLRLHSILSSGLLMQVQQATRKCHRRPYVVRRKPQSKGTLKAMLPCFFQSSLAVQGDLFMR